MCSTSWDMFVRDVVSVLNVSVSVSSRSWRYNVSDSVSWFRDFRSCEIHARHQACGYISKKIMNMTRKKQVVKWQTSPVSVLNCDTAISRRFLERLGLVSVLWLNVLWTSPMFVCHVTCRVYRLSVAINNLRNRTVTFSFVKVQSLHAFYFLLGKAR